MSTSKKIKVLIGPSSFAELDQTPLVRLVKAGYEVVENPFRRKLTREEVVTLLGREVRGLIAGLEPLDRSVLEQTQLKVISRVGSGLSNIDLDAARELEIKVFSTPDAPTESVAELTLGAMLNLIRMLSRMDRDLHEGKWSKRIGNQLDGKTVVVVGFGRIGRRVAELLKPFHVNLLVVDPFLEKEDIQYPLLGLQEAIAQADIITIHSSGDACILGKSDLSAVKTGALLLNAARGWQVDEKALAECLDTGRIGGAWLDVFMEEPYQGVLTKYPQVILTPHVGSYTLECRRSMETEAVDHLIKGLSNG